MDFNAEFLKNLVVCVSSIAVLVAAIHSIFRKTQPLPQPLEMKLAQEAATLREVVDWKTRVESDMRRERAHTDKVIDEVKADQKSLAADVRERLNTGTRTFQDHGERIAHLEGKLFIKQKSS